MASSLSLIGGWITFQVTFTEFFIAATVFYSVAYKQGWKSSVLGALLGAAAIVVLALVVGSSLNKIPFHVLDWISALLLVGFGCYLTYEFIDGLKKKEAAPRKTGDLVDLDRALNRAGIVVAAWAVMTEGLEILVVWLAVALKQGYPTATVGVGIGLAAVLLIALLLGKTGVFRKVPPVLLDGLAALFVTVYGIYFVVEALRA
jgi:uncharacterized membrane protein